MNNKIKHWQYLKPLFLQANLLVTLLRLCISLSNIVTLLACIARTFACSNRLTRKFSDACWSAVIADAVYCIPSLVGVTVPVISLTSLQEKACLSCSFTMSFNALIRPSHAN